MRAFFVGLLATSGCLVENPAWVAGATEASTSEASGSSSGSTSSVGPTIGTSGLESSTVDPTQTSVGTSSSTTDQETDSSSSTGTTGGATPELVAYYPMSLEGTILTDEGPDGLHGTCADSAGGEQCPLPAARLAEADARAFDGSTVFSIDDAPQLRMDRLSVTFWARQGPAAECTVYLGKSVGEENHNSFELGSCNERVTATVFKAGTERTAVVTGVIFGEWMHIAATHDGNRITLYINGQERGSRTDLVLDPDYDDAAFLIGGDFDFGALANFYVGDLDEVRLYNYPLTPEEVAALAIPGE